MTNNGISENDIKKCNNEINNDNGPVHKGANHVPKAVSDRDPLRDWDRDLNYVRSHALQMRDHEQDLRTAR